MSNNELHKILGARFKEHTQPTDEAVWGAIEAHLDEKQKDRSGIWFWLLNGTAIILICSAIQWSVPSLDSEKLNIAGITRNITEKSSLEQNNPSQKESTTNQAELTSMASIGENNAKKMEQDRQQSSRSKKQPIYIGETSNVSLESINPFPVFTVIKGDDKSNDKGDDESKDNMRGDEGHNDIPVDALPPIDLLGNYSTGAEVRPNCLLPTTSRNYFKNLPIYVGVEFSYLKRSGIQPESTLTNTDPTYATANDQLAFNRHYEMSTFVQLDVTRRFSASVGVGYSNSSSTSSYADTSSSITSSFTESIQNSKMELITVPVQARFNFLQKNRFSLNGGLTIQSEFGSITHSEAEPEEETWTSTSSSNTAYQESLIINKFKIRQLAFEPFVQASFSLSPRVSIFANLGYKMYLNQSDNTIAPLGRLNYYNADFGMLFRLK